MRVFENTHIDFSSLRKRGYIISTILLLISIGSLSTRWVKLGIDFKGGIEYTVSTQADVPVEDVAQALLPLFDNNTPEVKTVGESGILVRGILVPGEDRPTNAAVEAAINGVSAAAQANVERVGSVGARIATDLKDAAFLMVLLSLAVIFVYIFLRFDFDWRFGVGAVAALAHDVTITLGMFSLFYDLVPFSLEINQAIIAAFLTIVGYSLNDTVVVFDRIRERARQFKTEVIGHVVNRSINETLSRTVVTSGTTLLVVLTLFILGGDVLKGFTFALLIGVVVGTYSSIFVASPVYLELKERAGRN